MLQSFSTAKQASWHIRSRALSLFISSQKCSSYGRLSHIALGRQRIPSAFVSRQLSLETKQFPLQPVSPSPRFSRSSSSQTVAAMTASTSADPAAKPQQHVEKFRKDYCPVPYTVDTISLNFVLNEDSTRVEASMHMKRHAVENKPTPLYLDGRKDLKLESLSINGAPVPSEQYTVAADGLTLAPEAIPSTDSWDLQIVTTIKPQENSSLEGLYKSGGNYCSQCEAEGFRGITYFLDRPDVMAIYKTRIEADKSLYPVLLSNGNLVDQGDLDNGRHFTVWEDPFRKPSYLFALVAGQLAVQEDSFITKSGRKVALRIFVQEKNLDKVAFAMSSLKKAMAWDEEKFGLEYDLDLFNIVAVDDFNMGAMENKSLNIFNSRLVLATPDTATDGDFARIEGVVGHEYFHNYTGNRVTCRDWFQLTLKEGLTVYRDQEFSADMNSRPVKRIEDVIRLRSAQFAEDNSPMAHPIRPDSYIKMDNFYTLTVYEKGAEVVRLYETLLGKDGFRKGMDLYFQRHDGKAVTCDDFLFAMADANEEDLSKLLRWYAQAGTPNVEVSSKHDAAERTMTLKFKQSTPATPGQATKEPVLIPVRTALLGKYGEPLPLHLRGSQDGGATEMVLRVTEAEQSFVFEGIEERPVPSLLRGFSAPVRMTILDQTDDDLLFLLAKDTDAFNRWEAGHVLAKKLMLKLYEAVSSNVGGAANGTENGKNSTLEDSLVAAGGVDPNLVSAFKSLLADDKLDGMYKSFAISLPSDTELLPSIPNADPVLLYNIRKYIIKELALQLRPELEAAIKANDDPAGAPYEFNAIACARRALKNTALIYLSNLKDDSITSDILRRFKDATNMTDEFAALQALDLVGGSARQEAVDSFYQKWQNEPLVLLKWLTLLAGSNAPGNVSSVQELLTHPAFNISNPNSCYSLFLGFVRSSINFHAADGSGYEFIADSVLKLDKINQQVASRVVRAFTSYEKYDQERQEMMKQQLKKIMDTPGISDNVYEIASKSLH